MRTLCKESIMSPSSDGCESATSDFGHVCSLLTSPGVRNAMQSNNLEDPFGEWPALMEVERCEHSEHK